MTKIKLFIFTLFIVSRLQAQDTLPARDTSYWQTKGDIGLALNQAGFSSNWSGGGANSLSMAAVLNGKADYNRGKVSFTNELQLQYGRLYNQNEPSYLPAYRKTQDRIFADSKIGYALWKNWNVYGSFNFQSQFDDGYNYGKDTAGKEVATLTSRFMAPAFITESFGLEYKPVPYFYIRGGVGTLRQTIVRDKNLYKTNPSNFGVKPGETVRNELAFLFIASYDRNITENTALKMRYQAFANYEDLAAIDSRFDLTLSTRINKFLTFTFTGVVLYDQDQDTEIQYSESLALGLLYKF